MKFLDANVLIRFITGDDMEKARAALTFLKTVESGDEEVFISESVVAEVVYVLGSPRLPYHLTHEQIREQMLPILSMTGLKPTRRALYFRALDLFAASPFLDFEDALSVAHMEHQGIREIVSYDRGFDRVPGIVRVEP